MLPLQSLLIEILIDRSIASELALRVEQGFSFDRDRTESSPTKVLLDRCSTRNVKDCVSGLCAVVVIP